MFDPCILVARASFFDIPTYDLLVGRGIGRTYHDKIEVVLIKGKVINTFNSPACMKTLFQTK